MTSNLHSNFSPYFQLVENETVEFSRPGQLITIDNGAFNCIQIDCLEVTTRPMHLDRHQGRRSEGPQAPYPPYLSITQKTIRRL